jgi:hypothetical protein
VRFKLDENLPIELLENLRAPGHEGESVRDEGLTGVPDAGLLEHVRHEQRVLLTMDKGIADVRAYPPDRYAGIVLFRPPSAGRGTTLSFVQQHLPTVLERELTGHLLVVTERGVRLR